MLPIHSLIRLLSFNPPLIAQSTFGVYSVLFPFRISLPTMHASVQPAAEKHIKCYPPRVRMTLQEAMYLEGMNIF